MPAPNPHLLSSAPIAFVSGTRLFPTTSIRQREAASLIRLDSGRLLLAFRLGRGPGRRNDGAIMLTHSDDNGSTWDDPMPIYVHSGWDCLPMGGLFRFRDDLIRLCVGRVKLDYSLGGDEPFGDWFITAIDSRDGGETWGEPGSNIELFPCWTEMYGASNPHPLSDGRYLLAVIGTLGRDQEWQTGVTFADADGGNFTKPIIAAADPNRNFADTDVIRLDDGRFLMVIREMVTKTSVQCWSEDEGKTWTPIQPTAFRGSNIKLHRLRSGGVLCAYRDEDPTRRGVSVSVTDDGGASWHFVGQLYVADAGVAHRPGGLCGYPNLVHVSEREIVAVLHTYPAEDGQVDLQLLRLADRS